MDRTPPPDRHRVTPLVKVGEPPRFIVQRLTYVWWANKGTWWEKTADPRVGGVIYDSFEDAQRVRDQLNGETP